VVQSESPNASSFMRGLIPKCPRVPLAPTVSRRGEFFIRSPVYPAFLVG
jgi:hypothetical protein